MSDFAIGGARIYPVTSEPIDEGVIVVDGQHIASVGPGGGDASGLTLIPGLIDCHVHICFDGSPDFEAFAAGLKPGDVPKLCRDNLMRALEGGVTTVRDLGGIGDATIEAARAQRAGMLTGARILTAGQVLTAVGGHGHFIGREIAGADEMAKAVATLHESGADLIKIIATGGVLTKGVDAQKAAFTEEEMRAGVDEAHARGMRVAAHAIGTEGIEAAVNAGVDSVEHGCFMSGGALETMKKNPSWLVATLSAPDRISNGGDGVPEYARKKSAEVQTMHRASFGKAVSSGARIASGTDAGTPYNYIGNLSYELRLMHESGLSLDRVLAATTVESATLLGIQDSIGSLEPGKLADFVLLDGDPLQDVTAYERVKLVVQAGRIVIDRR